MSTLSFLKTTKKVLFARGFEYKEIVLFLSKNHSISTFKRRVKRNGLRIRQLPDYNIAEARASIQSIIDGPGCLQGYRSVWHTLQLWGTRIPRIVVQKLLRELDPEGTELRKAHRLTRRKHHHPGPNYSWHCEGYDKLKPFGFPIHGCIDGWSRNIESTKWRSQGWAWPGFIPANLARQWRH